MYYDIYKKVFTMFRYNTFCLKPMFDYESIKTKKKK